MSERWATFDCYGTLIDWNGGVRSALHALWPTASTERLLTRYHAVEPLVQEGQSLAYREVLSRCLRAIAAIEGLPLTWAQDYTLAESLPSWPAFPEVPAELLTLRQQGWRLAILSNTDPDLLAASLLQIRTHIDLTITAADAGSYKPAHGHWQRFYERSGASPARHVHVAASLFHDVAPTHELGIPCVWINRLGEHTHLPHASKLTSLHGLAATLALLVPEA